MMPLVSSFLYYVHATLVKLIRNGRRPAYLKTKKYKSYILYINLSDRDDARVDFYRLFGFDRIISLTHVA